MGRPMQGVRTANRRLLAALALPSRMRTALPISLSPGDTVLVDECWF